MADTFFTDHPEVMRYILQHEKGVTNMAELNLSEKDINELLTVLNIALSEARLRNMSAEAVQRDSHDWPLTQEEINTYRAYMDTIKKWIHIFSQQIGAPDLLAED